MAQHDLGADREKKSFGVYRSCSNWKTNVAANSLLRREATTRSTRLMSTTLDTKNSRAIASGYGARRHFATKPVKTSNPPVVALQLQANVTPSIKEARSLVASSIRIFFRYSLVWSTKSTICAFCNQSRFSAVCMDRHHNVATRCAFSCIYWYMLWTAGQNSAFFSDGSLGNNFRAQRVESLRAK